MKHLELERYNAWVHRARIKNQPLHTRPNECSACIVLLYRVFQQWPIGQIKVAIHNHHQIDQPKDRRNTVQQTRGPNRQCEM